MRAFSRRKLVAPSLESLLLVPHAPHPLPPYTRWEDPPPDPKPLPTMFSLSEAIPRKTLRSAIAQIRRIHECIQLALDSRLSEAVAARPKPLIFHSSQLFTPMARGFGPLNLIPVLEQTGPIEQLLPSRWPSRPPNSKLTVDFFLFFAHLFPDLQSVSYAAHGTPDHSSMPLTVVLCPPAVSALKLIAAFVTCTEKDISEGFTTHPYPFCPTWPFVGDSCSVHERNGKHRLCWDKSGPRKIPSFTPFNKTLPLDDLPVIVFVSIATSTREMAIFHSSGAPTLMWSCDLSNAYRQGGRQRCDIWKQGRITHRGCTVDWRGQFGDASQCNTANRVWSHCLWVARKLILALDDFFPPRDEVVLAWMGFRSSNSLLVKLGDVWAFFDDVHGGGINDQICCSDGTPLQCEDGELIFRCSLHFNATMVVFQAAGYSFPEKKRQPPSLVLDLLGALVRVRYQHVVVHPEKRVRYMSEIASVEEASSVERDFLNSLAHKLIYCACIMVRMRPLLFPIFKCLHAPTRTARALISPEARDSLRKCRLALSLADSHSLPFAAIEAFPSLGEDLLVTYADAAGEGEFAGMGFWYVQGAVCFLFMDEWRESEVSIPIHAREAFISSAATMSANAHFPHRMFCLEYTDNTPTEFVHESQSSGCRFLQTIIAARAEFLDAANLCTLPQRVSSQNNLWADLLSRGHWQRVLAMVADAGLTPVWVLLPELAKLLREALVSLCD